MNRMLTFKAKEQDRQGWGATAFITAGQWICIPALMVGGILVEGFSFAGLFFCVVLGGCIILLCACFVGIQSCRSGLPAVVMNADSLGVWGARCIPALLITMSSIGWFGTQTALCGASFSAMVAESLGISVPAWAATLLWGLITGIFAMQGYRVLRQFYYIITPALFLIVLYGVLQALFFSEPGSLAALAAWHPPRSLSLLDAITMTVGTWAMGTYVAGDYCRYVKKPRDAVLGISLGLLAMPALLLGGAALRIVTGSSDIIALLNGMGYHAMSLVFLLLSSWSINVLNAYYGGTAMSTLLGLSEHHLGINALLTALTGTALGATGILSRFTDYLSLLSSFVPPLIGVLAGAQLSRILGGGKRRSGNPPGSGKPAEEDSFLRPGFYLPGIIAYVLGALSAWLTTAAVPFFIPPCNGIIVAGAAYIISEKLLSVDTNVLP
jgi:cytosine permease